MEERKSIDLDGRKLWGWAGFNAYDTAAIAHATANTSSGCKYS